MKKQNHAACWSNCSAARKLLDPGDSLTATWDSFYYHLTGLGQPEIVTAEVALRDVVEAALAAFWACWHLRSSLSSPHIRAAFPLQEELFHSLEDAGN